MCDRIEWCHGEPMLGVKWLWISKSHMHRATGVLCSPHCTCSCSCVRACHEQLLNKMHGPRAAYTATDPAHRALRRPKCGNDINT